MRASPSIRRGRATPRFAGSSTGVFVLAVWSVARSAHATETSLSALASLPSVGAPKDASATAAGLHVKTYAPPMTAQELVADAGRGYCILTSSFDHHLFAAVTASIEKDDDG